MRERTMRVSKRRPRPMAVLLLGRCCEVAADHGCHGEGEDEAAAVTMILL